VSGTSPDSVQYPVQDYGLLTPYPPVEVSVLDFGADPTGNDDCYEAFLQTSASLSSGGVFVVPPGQFKLSRGVPLRRGVWARGAGRQSSRIVAEADFANSGGPDYSFFYNENWEAADLAGGDTDISVSGITFDYSWRSTTNAFKPLNFRYVERLRIENNYFYYGGNSIACRGCEQTWVVGNSAFEFRNCAWDFWEGPGTTYVLNNYAETSDTAQMMNFNPEVSPVASSPLDVIGKRLVVQGNVFRATGASSEPSQIEPLSNRQNGITDVIISGNQFHRSYLVHRGYVDRLVITGNTFNDFPDPNTNVILVGSANGFTPKAVVIANNVITEPNTAASSFGVIRCEVDSAIVTGNVITGTTYTGEPFYQGTNSPSQYGNWFEKLGITGRMRQGFILTNPNGTLTENQRSTFAWEDTNGDVLRMYMGANFHQFWSTDGGGLPRQVWSLQAANSTTQFNMLLPMLFSDGTMRISPETSITATGATAGTARNLTKCFSLVTTVAAGTGVRVPSPGAQNISGQPVVVFNQGANTLNVYPPSGGQIDALGVDIPDTIAAGGVARYYPTSNSQYYKW
jgi:hypothetical protein